MTETGISPFAAWESFYVIVGSSSAALTGLMFVVISLIPSAREQLATSEETISAFATPTVLHFCASLLVSALLSAPWRELSSPGVAVGAIGGAGVVYSALVFLRARRQKDYAPVFEDWLWHVALPFVAYGVLVGAGIGLHVQPETSMFVIAGAAILLLFIGIHNAWDTVTFIALEQAPKRPPPSSPKESKGHKERKPR